MTRRLTVLQVAYPFAPVGPDAAGGAEQVLTAIDEALVSLGHRSLVIAAAGSACAGELVAIPPAGEAVTDALRATTHALLRALVDRVAGESAADLVHLHGVDFHAYLPSRDVAVLATLHLPLSEYAPRALVPGRPRTWLNGVSASQMRAAPPQMPRVFEVPNGVPLDRFEPAAPERRRYAMVIGRICPEKGFETAIEAARIARVPLLLAGKTFPYEAHERYFRECIAPRLGGACRFVGAIGAARKRRLLSRARCLIVPSRVAETSSLVAMEALASGAPVVARRVGALPDIVEDGHTGLLADDAGSMADAIRRVSAIDRGACRRAAEERFDARRMTRAYVELYQRLRARRETDRSS